LKTEVTSLSDGILVTFLLTLSLQFQPVFSLHLARPDLQCLSYLSRLHTAWWYGTKVWNVGEGLFIRS